MKEFFRELFRTTLYKPNQGRIVRQLTAAGIGIVLLAGVYSLFEYLRFGLRGFPGNWIDWINGWLLYFGLAGLGRNPSTEGWIREFVRYGLPLTLTLISLWVAYRVVNMPRFADFLIAVEAELHKVSWPTRTEVIRSSIVVLVTIFGLAFVLYTFDFFWRLVFHWLNIL
ncbi:MAG: preprotein translocase subunit SecE [Thermoguttaceae bacterium]|nr:preprotein translocase subunit SecE [Thermoguttaceae bacterium]MDW8079702.1 preprotein translocase subunit SecE [Thermoguttaceae bacterium]